MPIGLRVARARSKESARLHATPSLFFSLLDFYFFHESETFCARSIGGQNFAGLGAAAAARLSKERGQKKDIKSKRDVQGVTAACCFACLFKKMQTHRMRHVYIGTFMRKQAKQQAAGTFRDVTRLFHDFLLPPPLREFRDCTPNQLARAFGRSPANVIHKRAPGTIMCCVGGGVLVLGSGG